MTPSFVVLLGTYKVRNETKRNQRKRNEINKNETKRNQRNENEIKRNQRNIRSSHFFVTPTHF
jgi:hypothetical protein